MKKLKLHLLIGCSLFAFASYAQTNSLNNSGNVGIGTTSPNSGLHLRNPNGPASLIVQGKQEGTVGNNASLILSTEYSTANNTSGSQTGRKTIIRSIANNAWGENPRLGFLTSPNKDTYPIERMSISPNGNIGIGTTTPQEKLTVKGKILCEEVEVVVDANAPDYVFEKYYEGDSKLKPSYSMPSLEEVEVYTKANKHLPEVPSAQDFKDNGMDLKKMNMVLLQKIEELTLYTIEQEKRIKALENKVSK